MYVLPPLNSLGADNPNQRKASTSRLHRYFLVPDPIAVRRALSLRAVGPYSVTAADRTADEADAVDTVLGAGNVVDSYDRAVYYGESVVLSGQASQGSTLTSGSVVVSGSYSFREELFSLDEALKLAFEFGVREGDPAYEGNTTAGIVGQDPSSSMQSVFSTSQLENTREDAALRRALDLEGLDDV
jgi:hypothetical protein